MAYIKKEIRLKVWGKYGRRCAYCGSKLDYEKMQIDHLFPKAGGGTDDFENLMPSCRLCNHYKRALVLETFRNKWLGELHNRLEKIYIVRVALRYGILKLKPFSKKFYFETLTKK